MPNSFLFVDCVCVARKQLAGSTDHVRFARHIDAYRGAGAPALEGAVETPTADKATAGAAAWTISTQFVGNDLEILVTGQAATGIDWHAVVDFIELSP